MTDELTLRVERPGEPPQEITSAYLIDESNAQYVAGFGKLDDHTVSLDLETIGSGRYWLSLKLPKRPILRFTIDIKGNAERTVRFKGHTPRCATITTQRGISGADASRRIHAINFALPPQHSAVVLVAGFDYKTTSGKPTKYTVFARQWRNDLYRGTTNAGKTPGKKIDRAIFDHTVVTIFDFETGNAREQIRGVKGWHTMYEFMCGSKRPHTANPKTDRLIREQTDSISITDVYAYINKIGQDAPNTLTELHFFSHAFYQAPILANTNDHSNTIDRDPNDKDPRPKDFHESNLARWPHLVSAFAPGARMKSWGCRVDDYIRHRIYAVMDTKDPAEKVDHHGSMISRNTVMKGISDGVRSCYLMKCVDVLGLEAWGAAPGTSSSYDGGYMVIDESSHGSIVRWYEKSFGGQRDFSAHFPFTKLKLGGKADP